MTIRRGILIATLAVVTATQWGCASLEKPFEPVPPVPQDKALVYIYRQPSFIGGGVYYTVNAGKQPLRKLYNGGYFPFVADPGEVELWAETESRSSVTLDLKPGETKYVKGTVGIGFIVGRPTLSVVDAAVGAVEIKECKLVPEEKAAAPK